MFSRFRYFSGEPCVSRVAERNHSHPFARLLELEPRSVSNVAQICWVQSCALRVRVVLGN